MTRRRSKLDEGMGPLFAEGAAGAPDMRTHRRWMSGSRTPDGGTLNDRFDRPRSSYDLF